MRRYEHVAPGDMVHVDIKKLGNIPDGGGGASTAAPRGDRNSRASTKARKNGNPVIGYACLHTAIDDHARLAYSEIFDDERMRNNYCAGVPQ